MADAIMEGYREIYSRCIGSEPEYEQFNQKLEILRTNII